MSLSAGTRLGPYEIRSALGAGGMGQIYRARDTTLNRDVAIKVLPDLFANDQERLARFRREAQVLAALNHPNPFFEPCCASSRHATEVTIWVIVDTGWKFRYRGARRQRRDGGAGPRFTERGPWPGSMPESVARIAEDRIWGRRSASSTADSGPAAPPRAR
jgi:serine/threonine protein kinase